MKVSFVKYNPTIQTSRVPFQNKSDKKNIIPENNSPTHAPNSKYIVQFMGDRRELKLDNIDSLSNVCDVLKLEKLKEVTCEFSKLKEVKAVVLGGSVAAKSNSKSSDFDVYIYLNQGYKGIPVKTREKIAKKFAEKDKTEINNQYWETGDEWIDKDTGVGFDIMYRTPEWTEVTVNYSLKDKKANVGYSTCFMHNIKNSIVLFDTNNWYTKIQEKVKKSKYPDELTKAIIKKNYPILRDTISSYKNQVQKAVDRDDSVSINHRISAFFASYFDIIFGVNKVYHPGEKRLVSFIKNNCKDYPDNMESDINQLLQNSVNSPSEINGTLDSLVNNMDNFLKRNNYKQD